MSGKSTLKNFTAMLADARLPEKTVPICLRGDLTAEWERLDRQLEEVRAKPSDSMAGTGEGEIIEAMEALREQMKEHTYDVVMRARPMREWRALAAKHPPRKAEDGTVDERDIMLGVNVDSFFDAIVPICMVDPELDDQGWARFQDLLTDKQFEELGRAAYTLNRGDVDIPFSRAASRQSPGIGGE